MYWENLTNKEKTGIRPAELDIFQQEQVKQYREAYEDAERWLNMPTTVSREFSSSGIATPGFLRHKDDVRIMQASLGIEEDGDWGPVTEKAFRSRLAAQKREAENGIAQVFSNAAAEREKSEAASNSSRSSLTAAGTLKPQAAGRYGYTDSGTAGRSSTNAPAAGTTAAGTLKPQAAGRYGYTDSGTAGRSSTNAPAAGTTAAGTLKPQAAGRYGYTDGGTAGRSSTNAPAAGTTAAGTLKPQAAGRYGYTDSGTGSRRSLTAAGKGESIARLGGTVEHKENSNQGRALTDEEMDRLTEALLDRLIEETKQRYYNQPVELNWRSEHAQEQRAEKLELYQNRKRLEELKLHHEIEKATRPMEDLYKDSPRKLIDVAVHDAEGMMKKKGYTANNYPHLAVVNEEPRLFGSEETLYTYVGSKLNYYTKVSGLEHMCGIYSVDWGNGEVQYVTGPVASGTISNIFGNDIDNVIAPFIASIIGSKKYAPELERQYKGAKVEYQGIVHSHPVSTNNSGEIVNYSESFSWGDGLAALFSGNIFLTTRKNHVFALQKDDAFGVVFSGLATELLNSLINNTKNEQVKTMLEDADHVFRNYRNASNFETLPYPVYSE